MASEEYSSDHHDLRKQVARRIVSAVDTLDEILGSLQESSFESNKIAETTPQSLTMTCEP